MVKVVPAVVAGASADQRDSSSPRSSFKVAQLMCRTLVFVRSLSAGKFEQYCLAQCPHPAAASLAGPSATARDTHNR